MRNQKVDAMKSYTVNSLAPDLFKELLTYLDGQKEEFEKNSENGNQVLSYGQPYKYVGAGAPASMSPDFPDTITKVVDKLKSRYPDCVINRCLINISTWNLDEGSFLVEHADDENSSDIFPVYVSQNSSDATIIFRYVSQNSSDATIIFRYVSQNSSDATIIFRYVSQNSSDATIIFRYVSQNSSDATIIFRYVSQNSSDATIIFRYVSQNSSDATIIFRYVSQNSSDATIIFRYVSQNSSDATIIFRYVSQNSSDATIIFRYVSQNSSDATIIFRYVSQNSSDATIIFRYVSQNSSDATIICGDSNTRFLKFGTGKGTFGEKLPGKRVLAFTIDQIDPIICAGYKNVFIHCGINDTRDYNADALSESLARFVNSVPLQR
ncbi:hypothetical protein ACHWQZ_G015758 [Mnemiopsis leidyi]